MIRSRGYRQICILLGCVLLLAGAYRMLAVATHVPVLGYANNYDMVRIQGCFHIWPVGASNPYAKSPAAPLPLYAVDRHIPGGCYVSSELLLVAPAFAYALTQPHHTFSLRVVGCTKAAIWVALVGVVAWLLWRQGDAGAFVFHAALFCVLICDPANTLYLNTFYAESSLLMFCYCALSALYFLGRGHSRRRTLCFLAALILLGMTKQQSLGVAAALALGAICVLAVRRARRETLAVTLVFAAICAAQAVNFARMKNTELANATDTFLGAVLPNAPDRVAALQTLGLPAHCLADIGKTWFSPGVSTSHPCPEVGAVSRARLLKLFLLQPPALVAVTDTGVRRVRPWLLTYLGHVAGKRYAKLADFSLNRLVIAMPDTFWMFLFLAPGIAGSAALLLLREQVITRSFWLLASAMALSMYAVFYSAVFGDGFFELSKHNYLFFNLMLGFYLLAAAYAGSSVTGLLSRWRSSRRFRVARVAAID